MSSKGGHIKIRIGASVDASVSAVFKSIGKRSEQSARIIDSHRRQEQKSAEKAAAAESNAAEKAAAARIRANDKAMAAQIRNAERTQATMARFHQRMEAEARRAAERTTSALAREEQKRVKETERQEARAARVRDRFATRTSHRATRFFMPNAPIGSMAKRIGSDLLRGSGLDFSLGGAMQRGLGIQTQASELATAGYIPGVAGPNGVRQNETEIEAEARALAKSKAVKGGTSAVLDAEQAFVTKTGDLETARGIMASMADLSAATQTNFADMLDAAGDVSNNLGNIPNKAAVIDHIMRSVAAQGKLGAVEIKDMASRMATLAAAAKQFEGDAGENIIKMGTLAQIARKYGGADSAAQASTAIRGFANTLQTPARVKEFAAHGVSIFDEQTKNYRDPFDIIRESLVATGGDPVELKKLFMNVKGSQVVQGLANEYRSTGGAKDPIKGIAAVDRIINENRPKEIDDSFIKTGLDAHLKTGAAKSTQAQEAFDQGLVKMRDSLVEKMGKITPSLEKFANKLGDVTTWVVENPKSAIGAAIGLSIARAGIESAFRTGIEKALGSGTKPGDKVGGLTGVLGAFGSALTIATVAVGALSAGMAAIDWYFDGQADEQRAKQKQRAKDAERISKIGALNSGDNFGDKAVAAFEADKLRKEWETRIVKFETPEQNTSYDLAGRPTTRDLPLTDEAKAEIASLKRDIANIQEIVGAVNNLPNKILQVHVVNQIDGPSRLPGENGPGPWRD